MSSFDKGDTAEGGAYHAGHPIREGVPYNAPTQGMTLPQARAYYLNTAKRYAERAVTELELAISATPTGPIREALTQSNIFLQEALSQLNGAPPAQLEPDYWDAPYYVDPMDEYRKD